MNFNSRNSLLLESRSIRIAGLVLSLVGVGVVFYSSTLLELLTAVLRREESSHGLFVPLLSLYFVWRKRSKLREIEPKYEIIPGLVLVAGGLLLFSLAKSHAYFFWECFAFVTIFSGLVICFFGEDWLKEILFPVVFLISMIPIPEHVYSTMADWLREAAISASTQVLALIGVPFLSGRFRVTSQLNKSKNV